MTYEIRFRRRAAAGESVAELNDRVLSDLSRMGELWLDSELRPGLDRGSGESAAVDLSPFLSSGLRGAISYASRVPSVVVDKSMSDDVMTIRVDASALDESIFPRKCFLEIVSLFSAYRASVVMDLDSDLDDFEKIVQESVRTGLDIDGRDSVFRISAVNFFDDELCLRAFGISAAKVVSGLDGMIEKAALHSGGAFLLLSSDLRQSSELSSRVELVEQRLKIVRP